MVELFLSKLHEKLLAVQTRDKPISRNMKFRYLSILPKGFPNMTNKIWRLKKTFIDSRLTKPTRASYLKTKSAFRIENLNKV